MQDYNTVYRVMEEIGLTHKPKRKPNGITKADKEAWNSDDLIKRDFSAEKPLEKCITDMTEIKASDGKLYVSAIFDCYDLAVLGLAMDTNMKAALCEQTLDNAYKAYPMLRGAILHSDRGTQYTSELYRNAINKYGILQSMNSAGGRCHDNARCESMWARFKEELLYGRYDATSMTVEQLKTLIWRYFISYWNNRRICSANGGLPPMIKRQQYYASTNFFLCSRRFLLWIATSSSRLLFSTFAFNSSSDMDSYFGFFALLTLSSSFIFMQIKKLFFS